MKILQDKKEVIKTGNLISPGVVIGNVCHYQIAFNEPKAVFDLSVDLIPSEINKLHIALIKSKKELESLVESVRKKLGENEAKIFEAHIIILEDKNLINKIENMIKNERVNVEYAIKVVFEEIEEVFSKMDDEYMKDRGTDIAEVKRRLLNHLTGNEGRFICAQHCINENRVVFTDELNTGMITLITTHKVKGFVVKRLSANSHAAILLKASGIPCISNIDSLDEIKCGTQVIIDGENSRLIINPSLETLNKYENFLTNRIVSFDRKYTSPIKYKDKEIEVYANLLTLSDLKYYDEKFSGIGLVRTEFLFYENKKFPDFNEQKEIYSEIVKEAKNLPVTFRLFDLGGDKKIKSLEFPYEENPLLGLRGIRFLLKNRKILFDQVKAILYAANYGKVKILIPMVTSISEVKEVKKIIKKIKEEEGKDLSVELGIMFEVPITVLNAENFIKEIDFGSIGSNDLLQYLYGIDRNNTNINYRYYNFNDDILFLFIKNLVDIASKYNKKLTLCGEIDYSSDFLIKFIEAGVKSFSISPLSFYNFVKRLIEN